MADTNCHLPVCRWQVSCSGGTPERIRRPARPLCVRVRQLYVTLPRCYAQFATESDRIDQRAVLKSAGARMTSAVVDVTSDDVSAESLATRRVTRRDVNKTTSVCSDSLHASTELALIINTPDYSGLPLN